MITYMSRSILSTEDTEEIRQLFISMDTDGNGTLSREEIITGFSKTSKLTPEEVEDILKNVDTDGNGTIDYTEFITATMSREKIVSTENL
jgi:calcium-dependent protein kinase